MPEAPPVLNKQAERVTRRSRRYCAVFSRVSKIVCTVMVFFGVMFIALTAINLNGVKYMYVVSDSMVPTFATGTVIIVDEKQRDVVSGDIIAFTSPWLHDHIVTHRIVGADDEYLVTMGDANHIADPPLERKNVIGKVVAFIPLLGYVFNPITLKIVFMANAGLGMLVLCLTYTVRKYQITS